ncbi:MAG TPA: prepilin peptidase [Candidatus Eisenbacteria bacterium]|nr:prepilin peptidase [Candidatus Eisenbacteria bacterium]
MVLLLLFIIGLCVGSFLNVVIDRIPHNISIVKGRSHCDFCNHVLSWYDLFPLFSFLFLQGHCRYCKKKLSWQYPLVECITGVLFIGLYIIDAPMDMRQIFFFILDLCIFSSALSLVVMDIKYHILSDKIVFIFAITSLLKIVLDSPMEIPFRLLVGVLSALPFFALFFLSKGKAMGFGDVKLVFVLGLILGFPNILIAYYIAFLTGGITAIILIIAGKKKLKGSTIAFGPFLFLGWLITVFYGNTLWEYIRIYLGI